MTRDDGDGLPESSPDERRPDAPPRPDRAMDRDHGQEGNGEGDGVDREALRASILRVIDYNTGTPQPEMISEGHILRIKSRLSPERVRSVLEALVDEGHLWREVGGSVPLRYRLAEDTTADHPGTAVPVNPGDQGQ